MGNSLKIGLALGSGGARGLAHAGVLQALAESGIEADFVSGTSMGSIVGGLYALDPDPAMVWERLSMYVGNEDFASYWTPFLPRDENNNRDPQQRLVDVFDFMQRKLIAVKTVTKSYMQSEEKLRDPLIQLFGQLSFSDLKIPLSTVALDLVSGESVIYREGSVVEGVYASSAIPSVFPPLKGENSMIVDGGGPYRVPIEACQEMGAKFIIAVDIPAFEETSFSTGLDMILRSNAIARRRLNRLVCAQADFVIRPNVTEFHWADFGAGEACRARGYKAAMDSMDELLKLMRWRRSLPFKAKMATRKLLRMD
ncbi:MAG: hypothetical protein GY780_18095 [bacterium]|nr:hypothetical protein [bacterium]